MNIIVRALDSVSRVLALVASAEASVLARGINLKSKQLLMTRSCPANYGAIYVSMDLFNDALMIQLQRPRSPTAHSSQQL